MTWTKRYSYYRTPKQGAYDSKFEAGYAQELEIRKKAKDIRDFAAHVRTPLVVNDNHVCDYLIDFVIQHNDGTEEYVETKGFATEVWKLKWKLFCALYQDDPGKTITLIMQGKQKPPKLRKYKNL